jgi:hypothetical protein
MSLNKSYSHARAAQGRATHQLQSDLLIWAMGTMPLVLLVRVLS